MALVIYAVLGVFAASLTVIGGLALWCHSLYGDVKAARDLNEKQVEVTHETADKLNAATARGDALELELKDTQDRLATAEAQRNAATDKEQDDVANRIHEGSVADARAALEHLSLLPSVALVPPVRVRQLPEVPDSAGSTTTDGDDPAKPV